MSSIRYIIPNTLANWPWKRAVNPRIDEIKDEVNTWVESLTLFEPSQLERFYDCDFNHLAALIVPLRNKEQLRITSYLMNLLFAFDEYTDVTNKDEGMQIVNDLMAALRREKDGIHPSDKIAAMAQGFIQRTVRIFGEDVPGMERFLFEFEVYAKSVTLEADDRVACRLRSLGDYLALRRDTIGVRISLAFLGLGLDIPDAVFKHPLMISLTQDATDLVLISNDMHSYSIERSRGLAGHNIITVIMKEYHLDLQQALCWLSEYASNTVSNFFSKALALPSWGEEIDQLVRAYIDEVGRFVRGTDDWTCESRRYYWRDESGKLGCREIKVLPPDSGYITNEQLRLQMISVA